MMSIQSIKLQEYMELDNFFLVKLTFWEYWQLCIKADWKPLYHIAEAAAKK